MCFVSIHDLLSDRVKCTIVPIYAPFYKMLHHHEIVILPQCSLIFNNGSVLPAPQQHRKSTSYLTMFFMHASLIIFCCSVNGYVRTYSSLFSRIGARTAGSFSSSIIALPKEIHFRQYHPAVPWQKKAGSSFRHLGHLIPFYTRQSFSFSKKVHFPMNFHFRSSGVVILIFS